MGWGGVRCWVWHTQAKAGRGARAARALLAPGFWRSSARCEGGECENDLEASAASVKGHIAAGSVGGTHLWCWPREYPPGDSLWPAGLPERSGGREGGGERRAAGLRGRSSG